MILPVLDLMARHVVRGIAGRRDEYRPLSPVSNPLELARLFRDDFGLDTLYVADLDAIVGAPPANEMYERLAGDGFTLWVDAGMRTVDDGRRMSGVARPIAGLETLAGPDDLAAIAHVWRDVVFSLDLNDGVPLAGPGWQTRDAAQVFARAIDVGVRSVLILDIRRVGVGMGTGTESLLTFARRQAPAVELTVGGGVRGLDDLRRLRDLGADHVLVASALHDGRLTRDDVASFLPATPGSP